MEIAFEIIPGPQATLGESPVWDSASDVLWWVDIDGRNLHRTVPATGETTTWPTPETPGFVVLTSTGQPAVGMETGVFLFDAARESFDRIVRLDQKGVRFNDACVDWMGRLWAGTMAMDGPSPTGVVFRMGPDRLPHPVYTGLYTPNGLAADPARQRLYLSDSHADVQTIWAVAIGDPSLPTPDSRRTFASTQALAGRPDGAALDTDGRYWIAAVGGGQAIHVFSPDGALETSIPVPVSDPTKPAFGGAQLDRLFLTSKGGVHPNGALATASLSGTRGMPSVPWNIGRS